MKLIKQKGPRCLIWAAAMVLDTEPEEIIEFVGRDCIAGVHIQEIQAFAFSKGIALCPYEPHPVLASTLIKIEPIGWQEEPWLKYEGIMLGETNDGKYHAVAWDGGQILDPAINPKFAGYHMFYAKMILNH